MTNEFEKNNRAVLELIDRWEPVLLSIPQTVLDSRRNSQNRTIKQIVGHMVDSASNNTHRMVHLQYQESPLTFPDYANFGNNDRWIAIQNYQTEEWNDLIQLWKYANRHVVHVIRNIDPDKLDNVWISGSGESVSLRAMASDYLRHLELHLNEIDELSEAGRTKSPTER